MWQRLLLFEIGPARRRSLAAALMASVHASLAAGGGVGWSRRAAGALRACHSVSVGYFGPNVVGLAVAAIAFNSNQQKQQQSDGDASGTLLAAVACAALLANVA